MENINSRTSRIPIILHGILDLIQINKLLFPGYSIYSNLNIIICKRIVNTIQQQNSQGHELRLESFIHDFALLRQFEYSEKSITFICINLNTESLNLVQLFYPSATDRYIYENLTETESLDKYPNYFIPVSPPTLLNSSPAISPHPQHTRLYDDRISCIIKDKLYLSGSAGAENLSQLLELGITHILNITDLIPNYFQDELDEHGEQLLSYMNIAIPDCGSIQISNYFTSAFEFIDTAIDFKGRVLIHCFAGKSRSATIVIGYIMKRTKWTFQEAMKYVQSCREIIEPNFGFCTQLMEYEKTIL